MIATLIVITTSSVQVRPKQRLVGWPMFRWQHRFDLVATARAWTGRQLTVVDLDAFAHPDQPLTGSEMCQLRGSPPTCVGHDDSEFGWLVSQFNRGRCCVPAVFDHIGERFLDDAKSGEFHAGR